MIAQHYKVCAPGHAAWDPRLVTADHVIGWAGPRQTEFAFDFSPGDMIAMGVFGDAYFGGDAGAERWQGLRMAGMRTPVKGDTIFVNTRGVQCKRINYFRRPASFRKDWWLDRGLIYHYDPLGWFEWFCWYYLGRRIPVYDDWQIHRWHNFKERHGAMYRSTPTAGHAQALLHWSVRAPDVI